MGTEPHTPRALKSTHSSFILKYINHGVLVTESQKTMSKCSAKGLQIVTLSKAVRL